MTTKEELVNGPKNPKIATACPRIAIAISDNAIANAGRKEPNKN